jgi:glutamate synthase (NADPH/NADH) large chain
MSGGTAYIYDLAPERVNADSLASGELTLLPLGSADAAIITDLLRRHLDETESTLAAAMLDDLDTTLTRFTKVLPRDYAAVLATRQSAVDEGLDPDGDVVWTRILEATNG